MQHQVSANGRSVLNSGITEDYKQAFAEYIWNGFDAGATEINISYVQANDLGALESVCISDNGKGMTKEFLSDVTNPFTTKGLLLATDFVTPGSVIWIIGAALVDVILIPYLLSLRIPTPL